MKDDGELPKHEWPQAEEATTVLLMRDHSNVVDVDMAYVLLSSMNFLYLHSYSILSMLLDAKVNGMFIQ